MIRSLGAFHVIVGVMPSGSLVIRQTARLLTTGTVTVRLSEGSGLLPAPGSWSGSACDRVRG